MGTRPICGWTTSASFAQAVRAHDLAVPDCVSAVEQIAYAGCTPATPREKGSVEGAVRYLKSGFWPARRFRTLSERDRVAHRRRHATAQFIVGGRLVEANSTRGAPAGQVRFLTESGRSRPD
jgi:hypothetical protein